MRKNVVLVLFMIILMSACSNQTTQTQEASAATDIVTGDPAWINLYSSVLNGQNELEIDFTDYNVGDETDVTKIRQYRGCGLYDLDKNGIPELFIDIWLWEGGFYHVFTVDNNAGKYVGESMGSLIEKSTGILFNVMDESGYTPNIAYEYIDNSLAEIPGYVQTVPENYSEEVKLGENILTLGSEDIIQIKMYDSFEEAVDNYTNKEELQ